jgi:hypothetical protein
LPEASVEEIERVAKRIEVRFEDTTPAASAMVATLLDDGPVLILCPSTLTLQWQVELADRLGIPSAVWSSTKKVWIDPKGHVIKTRGAEDIARWDLCSRVLARRDVVERLSVPW